ncbi:bifunctional pyr operon transcriptional regulator/uracil phosphoribosyltransferase PyrR [Holophaga foetida]|uniref:bifunctional pyr operon transcriptional regulator/uracil phosphoribosyltransferase PyrR n=1 Tax=Holophaga foetida TaxID=35839 RepID=UPI0002472105|nr:bifunctional pyr operon transcriptional regulator/uracil phosphoribosyltransferase PyrR [Holophaga foetida]
MTDACLLDAERMESHLQRLCREIAAAFGTDQSLALLGIRSRGLPLAERLAVKLGAILGQEVPVGVLDITLYRDDLSEGAGVPLVRPTEIPFSLKGRTVVLVDDVLFSGRTIRAALDALLDHGRPKRVWLAVLVDRGGRELPIQADFLGLKLDVADNQRVSVKVREIDGTDGVFLETRG